MRAVDTPGKPCTWQQHTTAVHAIREHTIAVLERGQVKIGEDLAPVFDLCKLCVLCPVVDVLLVAFPWPNVC